MLKGLAGMPPPGAENFTPGKKLRLHLGKSCIQIILIELIQYEPQTKTVFKEPILIIPAWIMKYYILGFIATEFVNQLACCARSYGLHHLMAQSR